MKLLFDQNLSHRLVSLLGDLFPGSEHVRSVGLQEADDRRIWEYAKRNRFTIVTLDSDYSDWNRLLGAPPKVIWVRFGNATVDHAHAKLRASYSKIKLLESDGLEPGIIEIW